jgi:hypothetical protein
MAMIDRQKQEPDPTLGREGMGKESSGSTDQCSLRNWVVKTFFLGSGGILSIHVI